jgi:hypothetical protein
MAKWWRPESGAWEQRIAGKLFGPPPPMGASRLEQMRFVRRLTFRAMLLYVPLLAVVLGLGTPEWTTIAILAFVLLSGGNVLSITLKIRRAEKAEREAG